MGEKMKKILRGPLISSIFYIALGAALTFLPVESVNIICKVVFGVVLILAGIYHVLIHLLEKNNATILDLFSGVILTVFGAFLFMNPLIVVKLLPIILGSFMLVDSLWTIRDAFRLKKRKRGSWKILFIISLIYIGLGATLIINPFKVVKYTIIFAGAVLISNGTLDLIFWGMVHYGIKKAEKEEKALEEEQKNHSAETEAVQEEVEAEAPVYEEWSTRAESSSVEALPEEVHKEETAVEEITEAVENDNEKKEESENE